MTWRSLYACSNGWRGLQPGCFEVLELPQPRQCWTASEAQCCILDGQDLGWTAAAGGASELLLVVDYDDASVHVSPTPNL